MAVDNKTPPKKSLEEFEMRKQILGLELVKSVLSQPKQAMINKIEFITVIRGQLCDGLLRHSIS